MSEVQSDRLPRLGILVAVAALVFPGPENTEGQIFSVGMQQIWATRLAQLVKEPPGWAEIEHHETLDLAFARDDQRLAVTITHHESMPGREVHFNTHLLVVDVHSPETNVYQFDLSEMCGKDLAWNESGNALLVCGTLLRLADGTSCDATLLPSIVRQSSSFKAFWLDSEHVVRSNTGEILDMACKQVGKWQLEPTWKIGAVAASKGWVLLWHTKGQEPNIVCEYSILDRASHEAPSGWSGRKLPCGAGMTLVVGAEAVCSRLVGGNISKGELNCWAINGGEKIPVPKQFRGYELNQTAPSSARVIAEKWEYDRNPWWDSLLTWWVPVPGSSPLPRRRVVFDLRSGNLVSSWKARIQDSRSPYIMDHPYHCVLSTSGEFLAESGDGGLELYRLVP
jgi:hypothetical protein